MKKYGIFVMLFTLILFGCGSQEVFEQVEDVYAAEVFRSAQVLLELPEDAAVLTMNGADGTIYFCEGYTLTVQTLAGGDLDGTFRTLTGFSKDDLTVMNPAQDRYEAVWTSAGDGGDQVGRLVLLDDGVYHYGVTVMADAKTAGELRGIWSQILDSVSLAHTDS